MTAVARYEATLGAKSTVRSLLKSAQFAGYDIEWLETGTWFESLFTIKGAAEDVLKIAAQLDQLAT